MKKLLNTILLTILLPLAAGAYDVEVGGIYYNLDDDAKTAEVAVGPNRDIVIPNSVIVDGVEYVVMSIGKYAFFRKSGLTSVTIPSSVTSIGGGAFYECSGLTSVMLHEGLTSIGNDAFYECSGLTSVTIPSSVTSIGSSAFNGCSGLTSLTLHEGLTSIGDWAFEFCRSLTSLTIPSSVTSIGNCAFRYCSSLTSLTILEGVTSIGNDAFGNCSSLTSLTILEGVTSIGSSAFNGCSSLTSLTIPSSVMSIGDGAFEDCRSLTSLTLHEGLTSIGNKAFCECSGLTSLTIPSSVTSIGDFAFYGCSGLTSLTLHEGLMSIGESAFYYCRSLTSLTIPSSVTSIGESAFSYCSGLTSLTILEGVTSIGEYAFMECHGLTSVTIPSSVTSIGDCAFYVSLSLTSVIVGWENPLEIDGIVFENSNYTNATLYVPKGAKVAYGVADVWKDFAQIVEQFDVSDGVVSDSQGLQYTANNDLSTCIVSGHDESYNSDLVIPSFFKERQVTSITAGAFSGCNDMMSLTVKIGKPLIIDSRAFENSNYRSIILRVPPGCKAAYDAADVWKDFGEIVEWFDSTDGEVADDQGVKYTANDDESTCYVSKHKGTYSTIITIPEVFGGRRVTSIGDGAFWFCEDLTSMTIPLSVTSIGDGAFEFCRSLTSLAIPEGVTSIGEYAFRECSGLTSVTIPSSVTSWGKNAFCECSGLTSLTLHEGLTSIGNSSFAMCSGLTSIIIPKSVKSIGAYAFAGCSGLTSLTILEGVTSIGVQAFKGCSGLTSLRIPSSVTSIGSSAFWNCSGLTSVTVESKTPIAITSDVFSDCPNATLYVPYGCKAAYESAPYWKEFKEIVELDALIDFADATVKTLCVENWDTNGDGELSVNEAAAVTDLGTVFSMSSIVTFNELQFFTGLTSISKAFSYCDKLLFITIPEGVTTIGDESFLKCKALTSVMLPNSVTSIGAKAFYECNDLLSMAIPSSVRTIGDEAFFGCSNLSSLSIPNGVTSIGRESFEYCHLESVVIPQSVISIGQEAFAYCGSLSSIEVESGNTVYDSRDKCNAIIHKSDNTLIAGCQTTEIPGSVTSIGTGAFRGSTGLKEITIPSSVTSIGDMAFWDCTNLTLVISEIEEPKDIASSTFSNQTYAGTLHVPAATKRLYQQAQGWKKFQTIVEERVPALFLTAMPEGGSVDKGTKVTLTVKDDLDEVVTDAEVFYTLDGSEPSARSTRYTMPIVLTEAVTLKALAMKDGYVQGELSTTYSINKVAATGVTLSASELTLTEGDDAKLVATVSPADADTELTWLSDDESVAIVSQNGEVRAVAPGSATITVTTDNGLSAMCEVTVQPKRVLPTGVTLSASELTLTEGDDAKLVATVSPADADTELTWSSDDESVATVDGEGTVVGVSVGTATITVTTDNGFLATCKVTVTERQQEHGEKQLVVVANLQAGEVAKGTEITLAVQDEDGETVDGADIYYTTDGRTPTQKSTHYEGVVIVNESMTLKAVAYKDGYTNSDVLRLAYIVIDDDSDLQWEDGESGVVYAFNTGGPMAKVQRVRSTAQGHVDIRENITVEGKTYTVTEIPKRAFAGASNVTSVTVPATVTTVGESAFANDGLLALIWQSNIEVPADALPEEGNRSKNFLLYVNRAGQAPYGMGNIVVKTADGYEMSEALTLIDGDNFHCPMAFRAANVSYTHSYTMTTGLGNSEGWETLALPFDVETIRHSDGRTLVPFASWRSDSDNAPFWLYTLSADGFVKAGRIQANTPYILSMPNNEAYLSAYNVGGEVTFAASNATIQPSAPLATATAGGRTFVPTFRKIRSSSSVATLNSVNRLHSNTGGEAPGSRFISNLRLASPFEAVFEGSADAVRSFGLQFSADGVNAIDEVPATRHAGSPRIYNLQGQRVSTMRKGNLYIMGGKKAMAK